MYTSYKNRQAFLWGPLYDGFIFTRNGSEKLSVIHRSLRDHRSTHYFDIAFNISISFTSILFKYNGNTICSKANIFVVHRYSSIRFLKYSSLVFESYSYTNIWPCNVMMYVQNFKY